MYTALRSMPPGYLSSSKPLSRRILAKFSHSVTDFRLAPLKLPSERPSLLPLILSSSNLQISHGPWNTPGVQHQIATRTEDNRHVDKEPVVPFFISTPSTPQCRPIGFLRPEVMRALAADHHGKKQSSTCQRSPWEILYSEHSDRPWSASFAPWVNTGGSHARTAHMKRLVEEWRHAHMFHDILRGWSDEPYPIYSPVSNVLVSSDNPVAFSIERASLPLFGFANFGCLLTAFFQCNDSGKTMLWIPRRSKAKRTWPGRLDVTVGGGMGLGDTASSTIVRECAEEASLDTAFVQARVQPAGVLSFPNRSPAGWILPGLYYLFDLPLPSDGSIRPQTNAEDGEVESFELMDTEMVLQNLLRGVFKPSSALALVDFLIRHGHFTEDSDPRFVDVCLLLRREMIWPLPRR